MNDVSIASSDQARRDAEKWLKEYGNRSFKEVNGEGIRWAWGATDPPRFSVFHPTGEPFVSIRGGAVMSPGTLARFMALPAGERERIKDEILRELNTSPLQWSAPLLDPEKPGEDKVQVWRDVPLVAFDRERLWDAVVRVTLYVKLLIRIYDRLELYRRTGVRE